MAASALPLPCVRGCREAVTAGPYLQHEEPAVGVHGQQMASLQLRGWYSATSTLLQRDSAHWRLADSVQGSYCGCLRR